MTEGIVISLFFLLGLSMGAGIYLIGWRSGRKQR